MMRCCFAALLVAGACSSEGARPGPAGLGSASGAAGSAFAGAGAGGSGAQSGMPGFGGSPSMSGSGGRSMGAGGPAPGVCTPSQRCLDYCAALGPDPSCALGDPEQCACVCERRFNAACPEELAAVLSCVGPSPASDCRAQGRLFPGCEQPSIELELCDFRTSEQLCGRSKPVCDPYCRAVRLSFCGQASESVAECLCGCEVNDAGRCEPQLSAFMNCTSNVPAFSCDANGELVPTSCAPEWQALRVCIGDVPADAGL